MAAISNLWQPNPPRVVDINLRPVQSTDLEVHFDHLVMQVRQREPEMKRILEDIRSGRGDYNYTEHPHDHECLLPLAHDLARHMNVPIRYEDIAPSMGKTDGTVILIDHGTHILPGVEAHTVLHEMGHVCLSRFSGPFWIQFDEVFFRTEELLAEGTGYVTAAALGLPTPFSADYLASYGVTDTDFADKRARILQTAERFVSILQECAKMRQKEMVAA